MEYNILVSQNNKNYKFTLSPELLYILKINLGEQLKFKDNGFLIRNSENIRETFEINIGISKSFLDLLSKYELTDEQKIFIENFKKKEKNIILDEVGVWAYKRALDDLIVLYSIVKTSNKQKDNNQEIKKEQIEVEAKTIVVPKITGTTELSKEILSATDDVKNNIELAKKVFERASKDEKFSKYFTKDVIEAVFKKIIVCKSDEEFNKKYRKDSKFNEKNVTEQEIEKMTKGCRAYQNPETGETCFRPKNNIDTIIHELVHAISLQKGVTGIYQIGSELIKENQNWNGIDESYIISLNEAMTHYITRELLPELEIYSAYNYGADFLKKYAVNKESHKSIMEAYFLGNKNQLSKIANRVDSANKVSWCDVLESSLIYQGVNMGLLPGVYLNSCKKQQEIDDTIKTILKLEEEKLDEENLKKYQAEREAYAKREQARISKINQIRNELRLKPKQL